MRIYKERHIVANAAPGCTELKLEEIPVNDLKTIRVILLDRGNLGEIFMIFSSSFDCAYYVVTVEDGTQMQAEVITLGDIVGKQIEIGLLDPIVID